MSRRRKQKYNSSSDDSDGEWELESSSYSSSEDDPPKWKKKYDSSDDDEIYSEKKSKKDKKSSSKTRTSRVPLGTMAYNATPQFVTDINPNDLTHSPAGDECRFVKFNEICDIILKPSKYLKPGEKGINTFLPEYNPGDANKLPFFGYDSELVTTDVYKISKMTDKELEDEIERINNEIKKYETTTECGCTVIPAFSHKIQNSIAIQSDVRKFPFDTLGKICKFDVITMDPPWLIAQSTITRGVAINYDQLDNNDIAAIPLPLIQDNGYIFVWVIASQMGFGIQLLEQWGYDFVCPLNWVKVSKYGRYMPSHGYYLQHNKETCLIGRKGRDPDGMRGDLFQDEIIEQRALRQSHKPVEIYELIEQVFPDCMYLEFFARPHNLREGWVSLGYELPN